MCDSSLSGEENDVPKLSTETLAVLQEFYREQNKKVEEEREGEEISENWQLSQFWYDDDTATTLAKEVIEASNNGRIFRPEDSFTDETSCSRPVLRICCLCAPTLYKKLQEVKPKGCEVVLFEYDKRFAVLGEHFVFYDYKDPLNIPKSQGEGSFDVVFVDPPFLSEECFLKVSKTVKYLMKNKVIFCTGLRMKELVESLHDAKPCQFIPKHKNNLMNEFRCYTNYDSKLNEVK